MTTRLRGEAGQAMVLTAVFILILVGLCGIVLDVGSWFRQQRVSQATVDAAALAGAQALPLNPGGAVTLATQYASDNGGVAGATFTVSSPYGPNSAITVDKTTTADGMFSKLFGFSVVTVHTKATAIAEVPTEIWGAAPIVVNITHPMLSGPGCPCFNTPTTIPLGKNGAPGSFAMVDLVYGDTTGTVGSSTMASWVDNGFQHYLPLGVYFSDSGAKFDDSKIQAALAGKYGTDLLFPVYDTLTGTGTNAEYHVIGWASFHLQLVQASGTGGTLSGYFDRVVWEGVAPPDPSANDNIPDLGVYTTALID
jgi:Flp pilus assembly protein TadG